MTCPGALRPLITRIRSNEVNCIRVGWKEPVLRGDVQVDSYRVGASADVHNFETRHFPYSVFATAFSRAAFFFEKIGYYQFLWNYPNYFDLLIGWFPV